jgi:hypothetical protein
VVATGSSTRLGLVAQATSPVGESSRAVGIIEGVCARTLAENEIANRIMKAEAETRARLDRGLDCMGEPWLSLIAKQKRLEDGLSKGNLTGAG